MKIRTITTGISLNSIKEINKIKQATIFNQKVKDIFEKEGYEVQTTRISTNSWEEYLTKFSTKQIINKIKEIEQICKEFNVSFFNIGYASVPKNIAIIPEINKNTSIISCSAKIGDAKKGIFFENVKESAKVIKRISQETENGYGNFRFCAWANCNLAFLFFL